MTSTPSELVADFLQEAKHYEELFVGLDGDPEDILFAVNQKDIEAITALLQEYEELKVIVKGL